LPLLKFQPSYVLVCLRLHHLVVIYTKKKKTIALNTPRNYSRSVTHISSNGHNSFRHCKGSRLKQHRESMEIIGCL